MCHPHAAQPPAGTPAPAAPATDRHGGPGAGWYRPGPGGWHRITDLEAITERWADMAHFMNLPAQGGTPPT